MLFGLDLITVGDGDSLIVSMLKVVLVPTAACSFAYLLLSDRRPAWDEPYPLIQNALVFAAVSGVGVYVVDLLITPFLQGVEAVGVAEDLFRVILAHGISNLFFGLVLFHLHYLDRIAELRRTKFTKKARKWILVSLVLLFLSVFFGITDLNDQSGPYFAGVALGSFVVLGSLVKIPWLQTLSKREKWRTLGLSLLACLVNVVLVFEVLNDSSTSNVLSIYSRGMDAVLTAVVVYSTVMVVRLIFGLLNALPTAAIMDRKIREVQSLSHLSRIMAQVHDYEVLLQTVSKFITDVTGAAASWVVVEDGEGGVEVTAHNLRNSEAAKVLHSSSLMNNVIVENRREIVVEELRRHKELYPALNMFTVELQSLIAVPLISEGSVIGALYAVHPEEFAFERQDVALLATFADHVAIALENARLFASSLEQERYKKELLVAREIQEKLLPTRVPFIPGISLYAWSSPAYEVGGDYYDFIQLSNGDWCVVVADVSGKGVSAALYMAELKGFVQALARLSVSPADLLKKVNNAIIDTLDKQTYVTMIAVALHVEQGMMTVARAGHTPAAVKIGDSVALSKPKGMGVGLTRNSVFGSTLEEQVFPLRPGVSLLLYTDGINEAANEDKQDFGTDGVLAVLRESKAGDAENLCGDLIRALIDHTQGIDQTDDITILGIVCAGSNETSL